MEYEFECLQGKLANFHRATKKDQPAKFEEMVEAFNPQVVQLSKNRSEYKFTCPASSAGCAYKLAIIAFRGLPDAHNGEGLLTCVSVD